MSKPVILTGLRANNDLHIGNYLGALLPLVDMATQKAGEYQINLFVPDLHSFTTPIDHAELQAAIVNNLRIYAAAGLPLESDDVFIYRQSYISAHSELTWILDCFTGMGEMNRMTQFKDKTRALNESINEEPVELYDTNDLMQKNEISKAQLQKKESRVSVGLFNYPVLMAADILLYGAQYIPVGDDQTQHLEFARDIAGRMNNQFGELFIVPESVAKQHEFFGKDQGLRVKDLQNPLKKMSKSDKTGKGVIFLNDSPEEARKKIMSATTDNLQSIKKDSVNQPGVTNLLEILDLFRNIDASYHISDPRPTDSYKDLKEATCQVVCNFLTDFQQKLAAVDEAAIMQKLEASEVLMRDVAGQRLHKVQQAVGLRP